MEFGLYQARTWNDDPGWLRDAEKIRKLRKLIDAIFNGLVQSIYGINQAVKRSE